MPSNWLYIDTNFPAFTGEESMEEKVTSIQDYMYLLVEQLRFQSQEHDLLPEQRREKSRIMQRILRNDAQIRCLAEPWLAQFEHLFEGQPQMMH